MHGRRSVLVIVSAIVVSAWLLGGAGTTRGADGPRVSIELATTNGDPLRPTMSASASAPRRLVPVVVGAAQPLRITVEYAGLGSGEHRIGIVAPECLAGVNATDPSDPGVVDLATVSGDAGRTNITVAPGAIDAAMARPTNLDDVVELEARVVDGTDTVARSDRRFVGRSNTTVYLAGLSRSSRSNASFAADYYGWSSADDVEVSLVAYADDGDERVVASKRVEPTAADEIAGTFAFDPDRIGDRAEFAIRVHTPDGVVTSRRHELGGGNRTPPESGDCADHPVDANDDGEITTAEVLDGIDRWSAGELSTRRILGAIACWSEADG